MTKISRALPLVLLALAGCTSTGTNSAVQSQAVVQTAPMTPVVTGPTPAQTTSVALAAIDATPFLDPGAVGQLSPEDKRKAADAQFYALQFGRPGAPRNWAGSAKGAVSVGPYVRVNNLDCRDFTHTVTVGGKDLVRKGTACREQNGSWSVVDSSSAA